MFFDNGKTHCIDSSLPLLFESVSIAVLYDMGVEVIRYRNLPNSKMNGRIIRLGPAYSNIYMSIHIYIQNQFSLPQISNRNVYTIYICDVNGLFSGCYTTFQSVNYTLYTYMKIHPTK